MGTGYIDQPACATRPSTLIGTIGALLVDHLPTLNICPDTGVQARA
jgi:hypothetical protein